MIAKVVNAHAPKMLDAVRGWVTSSGTRRLAAVACMTAALSLAPIAGAEAAAPKGLHIGSAFGTQGNVAVGPLAGKLGATAFMSMPCLGTGGEIRSSDITAASVGLLGVTLSTSLAVSTVQTTKTSKSTTDEVTSRVEGLKALGGLLSADSIVAVSRTTANQSAVTSKDTGSSFANLKVAGQSIPVDVPANTSIPLPGVGAVILKRETASGDGVDTSSLSVDMIVIQVTTANTLGLPVGAEVIIGNAVSGFSRGLPNYVYAGEGIATNVVVNLPGVGSAGSGATGLLRQQCNGTGGDTKYSKIAALNVNGLLTTGAVSTSVYGSKGVAKTVAKLTKVSLLGGLVSVRAIKAVAQMKYSGGRPIRSTEGTTISGLTVLGLPVVIVPNLVVDLPGIGSITVNEQKDPEETSEGETVVNALRIDVTKANLLGLPIGAKIVIGHASAGVVKP